MANIRLIRRHIRSAQNIAKITRAMQMIAASKMKRAQERSIAGRPYAEKIHQVIDDLVALPLVGRQLHPLLQSREVKHIAVVHITPDRGLCGGLIGNLNRMLAGFILGQESPASVIGVGRRGVDFARRHCPHVRAEFSDLSDRPSLVDTLPISRIIMEDFTKGLCDRVYLSYARFVSTVVQRPVMEQILPVEPAALPRMENVDYIYEPDHHAVLDHLVPRFVEMQVYQAMLEAIASEQSARMVAMKNATDNAGELIEDLTLKYNKARQETITKELLDIVGGAEALK